MTRLARFTRRLALCLAFLQFGMQGVFAVADGYAEAAGEHAQSHIESHSSKCPRVHTDACRICQFLANGIGPLAQPAQAELPQVVRVVSVPADPARPALSWTHSAALPRAPPVA